ncbi:ATP synthase subunit I [Hazenella coriacea]|uniref:ATP synthase I subunit n=1 Tax=Hazenella coriacea TaxID=1179467 RepID=A0A4R3L7E7_9BACL|nr:ATP synthase subunit I [Hazenella coriacea]TCS95589.1 ATP synthase I subunit [Hazenella coriacea]
MDSLHFMRTRIILLTVIFLSLLLISWFIFPFQKAIAGLMIGVIVSLYNILHLARRLRIAGEVAIATGSLQTPGIGMMNRILMICAAFLIAIQFPELVDFRMIFLGLPVCYIIAVIVQLWFLRIENNT